MLRLLCAMMLRAKAAVRADMWNVEVIDVAAMCCQLADYQQTCSRRVSLESRKGTWVELGSALALMHIPSDVRDRLMLLASDARRPGPKATCQNTRGQ